MHPLYTELKSIEFGMFGELGTHINAVQKVLLINEYLQMMRREMVFLSDYDDQVVHRISNLIPQSMINKFTIGSAEQQQQQIQQ